MESSALFQRQHFVRNVYFGIFWLIISFFDILLSGMFVRNFPHVFYIFLIVNNKANKPNFKRQ